MRGAVVPLSAAQECRAGWSYPPGSGRRTTEEQGLGEELGGVEAGARGLLKRVKMTGQVRAVSGLRDFQAGAC